MSSADRLNMVMGFLGLNKNSFSKEIGMSSNVTIGRIINEDRKPSRRTLQMIVDRFPQISLDWLLTGEGEMLKDISNVEKPANRFTGYTDEQIKKMISEEFSRHILEMYEDGRAYPAAVVANMRNEMDVKLLTVQQENWRLNEEIKSLRSQLGALDNVLQEEKKN